MPEGGGGTMPLDGCSDISWIVFASTAFPHNGHSTNSRHSESFTSKTQPQLVHSTCIICLLFSFRLFFYEIRLQTWIPTTKMIIVPLENSLWILSEEKPPLYSECLLLGHRSLLYLMLRILMMQYPVLRLLSLTIVSSHLTRKGKPDLLP